jgi:hypothetical protein
MVDERLLQRMQRAVGGETLDRGDLRPGRGEVRKRGGLAPTIQELQAGGCESLRAVAAGLGGARLPAARGRKWWC